MAKKSAKQIAEELTFTEEDMAPAYTNDDLLKTGSTLMDLNISGSREGGLVKGRYFWMAGHSGSGKTFLTLTALAEASINVNFDEYDFIYDNVEDGALMDFARYFGPRMARRLQPPRWEGKGDERRPVYSVNIEDFYFNLDDHFARVEAGGRPWIYLLDSMDALDSKYAEKKFQEAKGEAQGGAKAKGDYGDGKAKINSQRIRRVTHRLRDTGCILIVLSQARDNIDGGPFDEDDVYAGGRALRFYATVQIVSRVGAKIKKTVKGKEVVVGANCNITLKKNRLTGVAERLIKVPIYYDVGIDDIGSMVDYLCEWKFWKKSDGGIVDATTDFDDTKMRREDLIHWIEENDLREDLEEIVQDAFEEIQRKLEVKRKNKYAE